MFSFTLGMAFMYFYPRPPRGGRQFAFPISQKITDISIHALREEGDQCAMTSEPATTIISIHALREEGDGSIAIRNIANFLFLSTPSARRATIPTGEVAKCSYISIHALREEGDRIKNHCRARRSKISIHALREEGDSKNGEKYLRFCFSIKRSAQIWKSFFQNIRKNSCDLHRMP